MATLTGGDTFADAPQPKAASGSRMRALHDKTFLLLERPRSSRAALVFHVVLVASIMTSILTYFLTTVESVDGLGVNAVDLACNVIFTLELAMRLFLSYSLQDWRAAWKEVDMYIAIDALSLLPFCLDVYYTARDGTEIGASDSVPSFVSLLGLLKLLRVFKLLRHYSGWRVLILAFKHSARPVGVPMFAMLVTTLVLGGLLQYIDDDVYPDAFEAMWTIFWLVTTLDNGSQYDPTDNASTRTLQAVAIVAGLFLTTMPITIIGNAFAGAWEKKEMIEVGIKVRELLEDRGLKPRDVESVFHEFDTNGSGNLEFDEFRSAMRQLHNDMPWDKLKRLFRMFDKDESGTIDHAEFCGFICPALVEQEQADAESASSQSQREEAARARVADSRTVAAGAAAEARAQAHGHGAQQRHLQKEVEEEEAEVDEATGVAATGTTACTLRLQGDPDAVRKVTEALQSLVGLMSAEVSLKVTRGARRSKSLVMHRA